MFRSVVLSSLLLVTAQAAECPETWVCPFTETPPTLDADHSEWASVTSFSTSLVDISGNEYTAGKAELKCLHDNSNIYFALEIPGEYNFDTEDNHLCAAIGTMFKVGSKATYINMGGCPDAATGCDAVPDTCTDYLVDIGAHWELRTTEQGVMYGMNATSGTGNDLVANKDDEYGVSPMCRFDDDDDTAGNEWSGAWAHSQTTIGEMGEYTFELSRSLTTASTKTDAQLAKGGVYKFGIAYWDPNQLATGWTDAGHYLTGCGSNWVDLVLGESSKATNGDTDTTAANGEGSSAFQYFSSAFMALLSVASALCM